MKILRLPVLVMLVLLSPVLVFAVPQPWTISNLDLESTTWIVNSQGSLLTGPVRIELYLDQDGDGIDPVNTRQREQGVDTGDDSLLISTQISLPIAGIIPNGAFAFFLTVDTDSSAMMQAHYFVRVWEGADIHSDSRFANSLPFTANDAIGGMQTRVIMPDCMAGYLGNRPPVVSVTPPLDTPMGGEVSLFSVEVGDDEPYRWVRVIQDGLPGEFEVMTPSEDGALIQWQVPTDAAGDYQLPVVVSDGQFLDTTYVDVTILEAAQRPGAFRLVSPGQERPAFQDHNLVWQRAIHPGGESIEYTLEWSSDPSFTVPHQLSALIDTFVTLSYEQPELTAQSDEGLGQVASTRKKRATSHRVRQEIPHQSHLDELDDVTVTLPYTEGTQFFWRVKADAEDGSTRWCYRVQSAYAELPEAPVDFSLVTPADGSELEIATPTFTWHPTTDLDLGDTLRYEFLWSVDDGATFDTVNVHADTAFVMGDAELFRTFHRFFTQTTSSSIEATAKGRPAAGSHDSNGLVTASKKDGSTQKQLSPKANNKRGKSSKQRVVDDDIALDEELPQDMTITWKVDAVDLAGMRRSSSETWTLQVAIPDGPSSFNISSPANGDIYNGDTPVRLSWTMSIDPDPEAELSYSVYMVEGFPGDPEPSLEEVAAGVIDTSWTFQPEQNILKTWLWRVCAVSGEDTTWNTDGVSHFVLHPPLSAILLSPLHGDTIEITSEPFRWQLPDQWEDAVQDMRIEFFSHPAMETPELAVASEDTLFDTGVDLVPSDYWWQVVVVDQDGNEWESSEPGHFVVPASSVEAGEALPTAFAIENAYPNPFNPTITVMIAIPRTAPATLTLYDILGREVYRKSLDGATPGYHITQINLLGHAAGVYLLRLHAAGVDKVERVVLLK